MPGRIAVAAVIVLIVVLVLLIKNNSARQGARTFAPPPTPMSTAQEWPADRVHLPITPFLPALNIQVESLLLFNSADNNLPKAQRSYSTEFVEGTIASLNWELTLRSPLKSARQYFKTVVYLYGPDGQRISQTRSSSYIEPAWTQSYHADRLSQTMSATGTYHVSLFIDGIKAAATTFNVVAPQVTQTQPNEAPASNTDSTEPKQQPPPISSPEIQASFDCKRAQTQSERIICALPELASLDLRMARQYYEMLNGLAGADRQDFAREHLAWFKNYSRTCNSLPTWNQQAIRECVRNNLTARLSNLQSRPAPASAISALTNEAQQRAPLEQDCVTERRLSNQSLLGLLERDELARVRGTCEKLYGVPAAPEAPKPSTGASAQPAEAPDRNGSWRRSGEARVGGEVVQPELIKKVSPTYPPLAKQARVEGKVRLSATVGVNGKLRDIHILSGHPVLVSAATDAVRRWEYRPGTLNGRTIDTSVHIDVTFTLSQ